MSFRALRSPFTSSLFMRYALPTIIGMIQGTNHFSFSRLNHVNCPHPSSASAVLLTFSGSTIFMLPSAHDIPIVWLVIANLTSLDPAFPAA
jgi:hypothetical protein